MPEFFPSKIYAGEEPAQANEKHHPVFSILSLEPDFDLEAAKRRLAAGGVRILFVLVNGQQLPTVEIQVDEADAFFGRALTGAHRIYEHFIWRGGYQIYTGRSAHPNVASRLFDAYHARALVLDILNAKFEWEDSAEGNGRTLDIMQQIIVDLLSAAADRPPELFLAGFSRGGVFALELTSRLLTAGAPVKTLVTIDPVIAPRKEDGLVAGWGMRDGQAWSIQWSSHLHEPHFFNDVFPILRNPGTRCYNVFQRNAFFALNAIYDKPIGCAVAGAEAPGGRSGIQPAGSGPYLDQFDISVHSHSGMLEKYVEWIPQLAAARWG